MITGAAGFIGNKLAVRLLDAGYRVIGVDNFVRGTRENLEHALERSEFTLIEADLADPDGCRAALGTVLETVPVETVWHMAANSDILAGVDDPNVDHRDTFLTTFNTLALMKEFHIRRIAFASSGVIYGFHDEPLEEETGPLFPLSTYGAMKLASEAVISASLESFLEKAYIFRFPNTVGGGATHGVIFDFINKLRDDPTRLEVLGDGRQQKPYIHVSELIDAMFFIVENAEERLAFYNIGPEDDGANVTYIAKAVCKAMSPDAEIHYTGGDRGWVGDVPRYSYATAKLAALGWRPRLSSNAAVDRAVSEILEEAG